MELIQRTKYIMAMKENFGASFHLHLFIYKNYINQT